MNRRKNWYYVFPDGRIFGIFRLGDYKTPEELVDYDVRELMPPGIYWGVAYCNSFWILVRCVPTLRGAQRVIARVMGKKPSEIKEFLTSKNPEND